MDANRQTKRMLSAHEAAAYLRQLAGQLENGSVFFDEADMDVSGVVSLKESLKSKSDKNTLKVKLKIYGLGAHPGDDEDLTVETESEDEDDSEADQEAAPKEDDPADAERPSYKRLKKRLQKAYKAINDRIGQGKIADLAVIQALYNDCLLMTSYSGKGDVYYPQFIALAERVLSTAEAANFESFKAAMAEIKKMKAECHDRYK